MNKGKGTRRAAGCMCFCFLLLFFSFETQLANLVAKVSFDLVNR